MQTSPWVSVPVSAFNTRVRGFIRGGTVQMDPQACEAPRCIKREYTFFILRYLAIFQKAVL